MNINSTKLSLFTNHFWKAVGLTIAWNSKHLLKTLEDTEIGKSWFNPPYGLNVKTNISKVFLKLVRKHFPRSHKLSKIFNLNTIKISYSSMPNVKNLIKQHNSKILNKDRDKIQRPCNCRIKESCPLNGKCLHQCMVYKAEVSTNTTYEEHYGASDRGGGVWFKSRNNNHTQSQSFRNTSHINDMELSK